MNPRLVPRDIDIRRTEVARQRDHYRPCPICGRLMALRAPEARTWRAIPMKKAQACSTTCAVELRRRKDAQ